MAQVHAVMAEEEPYWTDGYTSLSQAEVAHLSVSNPSQGHWGKKGGLAQIHANGENIFSDGVAFVSNSAS
jgi:hypothetical protein